MLKSKEMPGFGFGLFVSCLLVGMTALGMFAFFYAIYGAEFFLTGLVVFPAALIGFGTSYILAGALLKWKLGVGIPALVVATGTIPFAMWLWPEPTASTWIAGAMAAGAFNSFLAFFLGVIFESVVVNSYERTPRGFEFMKR